MQRPEGIDIPPPADDGPSAYFDRTAWPVGDDYDDDAAYYAGYAAPSPTRDHRHDGLGTSPRTEAAHAFMEAQDRRSKGGKRGSRASPQPVTPPPATSSQRWTAHHRSSNVAAHHANVAPLPTSGGSADKAARASKEKRVSNMRRSTSVSEALLAASDGAWDLAIPLAIPFERSLTAPAAAAAEDAAEDAPPVEIAEHAKAKRRVQKAVCKRGTGKGIELDLRALRLTELPPDLAEAVSLRKLDVSYNECLDLGAGLTAALTGLSRLTSLRLAGCVGPPPPPSPRAPTPTIERTKSEEAAHRAVARARKVNAKVAMSFLASPLPPGLKQPAPRYAVLGVLPRLTHLDLSAARLHELPAPVFECAALVRLDVRENSLSDLPQALFAALPRLEELDAQRNNLSALPDDALADAQRDGRSVLRWLDVSDQLNSLSEVREEDATTTTTTTTTNSLTSPLSRSRWPSSRPSTSAW